MRNKSSINKFNLVLHRLFSNAPAWHALSWRCSRTLRHSAIAAAFALTLLILAAIAPIYNHTEITEAAIGAAQSSTLTLDVNNNTASLDLSVSSSHGTFISSTSDNSVSFNVSTNNYSGYKVSLTGSDDNQRLTHDSNSSYYLSSISGSVDEDSFSANTSTAGNNYNGKWGYNLTINDGITSDYFSAPTTIATTLDETSSANSTANNYKIGIGARADYSQPGGIYTGTYILAAISNPINYTITYEKNATDAVSSVPDNVSTSTSETTVALSSTEPARAGYVFLGWCLGTVAKSGDADICLNHSGTAGSTGTVYQPGASFGIDQTTVNAPTLTAMWDLAHVGDMQGLAPAKCATTPAYTTDNRDNTTYVIQRLADGNCWLLDNLQLNPTASTTAAMTSANTNAPDNILATFQYGTTFTGISQSGWYTSGGVGVNDWSTPAQNSYNAPRMVTKGNCSSTANCVNSDTGTWSNSDVITVGTYKNGKIGNYYNFCAASAGTYCYDAYSGMGNAVYDICPNGWRIPSGGVGGEYSVLYGQYNNYDAFVNALRTPLSGNFGSGVAINQNSSHLAWSSTYRDTGYMFRLRVDSDIVYAENSLYRSAGFSIRCILDERTYMQDLTNDSIAALLPTEHSTATVYDKRDGQDYAIAKLKDGKYWMTKNLNLAGGTVIESTLSAVPEGYVLPTANGFQEGNKLPASSTTGFTLNDITAFVYNSNNTDCDASSGCYSYYSWVTATAGSGVDLNSTQAESAPYSICPKGWKMPTYIDFSSLGIAYDAPGTTSEDAINFYTKAGPGTIPNFAYAGHYMNSEFRTQYSAYWSSTAYSNATNSKLALSLLFLKPQSSGTFNTTAGYYRRAGYSIRCLFEGTVGDGVYMQDVTSNMVAELSDGDNYTLVDRRDENTYTVKKINGQLWMTQNLRFVGSSTDPSGTMTLKRTDSNVANTYSVISPLTITYDDLTSGDSYDDARLHVSDNPDYGVYYNYAAATAGTITGESNTDEAQYDICPMSWHLPSLSDVNQLVGYTTSGGKWQDPTAGLAAFNAIAAGRYNNGSFETEDVGVWWYSTATRTATNSYGMGYSEPSGQFYLHGGNGRAYGLSVRCVFGG